VSYPPFCEDEHKGIIMWALTYMIIEIEFEKGWILVYLFLHDGKSNWVHSRSAPTNWCCITLKLPKMSTLWFSRPSMDEMKAESTMSGVTSSSVKSYNESKQ